MHEGALERTRYSLNMARWHVYYTKLFLNEVCDITSDNDVCALAEDADRIEQRIKDLLERYNHHI